MRMRLAQVILSIMWIYATLVGTGCSSTPDGPENTPGQALFEKASKELQEENYIQAIEMFNEVKTKYPYSKYAKAAELSIADAYYGQESFPEAAASYQGFVELYPKDDRASYALFRQALSTVNQVPSQLARDLTKAREAISILDEVSNRFPQSKFVTEAKSIKLEMRKKLAAKEDYIGNFYFVRDLYLSAANRYAALATVYPGLGFDEIAHYRAGVAYARAEKPEMAEKFLKEFLSRFPQHPLSGEAKEELKKVSTASKSK